MGTTRSAHDDVPSDYRFGEFVVDPGAALLLRDGEPVHLEPKVFEVLVFLIEHRNRIVGKEELVEQIWQGAFVTDNALTKAIARLRRALGDDPHQPRFIETAHSRGYRFIGTLEQHAAPRADRSSRAIILASGLVIILISAVVLWQLSEQGPKDSSPAPGDHQKIESLAVLPLENLSGDPGQDYIAEGLHELLTTELASLRSLRVISRQSTLQSRTDERSIAEIAAELEVDAIMKGSVMRTSGRTQVNIQLFPGDRDTHLWARSFGRQDENLLALLSDIARAVAAQVDAVLTAGQESRLAAYGSADLAAQEAYLRARYLLSQGKTAEWPETARLLNEAITLDPEFAAAHSALAGAHVLSGFFGLVPPDEARERAEASVQEALSLDPQLADAHSALGFIRLYFDWDIEAAGRSLAVAIELNPNDANVRHAYGDYLTALGRVEEGLEQVRIGRQSDPASPLAIAPVLGHLLFLRRYEEVVDESRALLEADPSFFLARSLMFRALWQMERYQEALDLWRDHWSERDPEAWAALEQGWVGSGPAGAMLGIGRFLSQRHGRNPGRALAVARYFAAAGARDEAFDYLELALEGRVPQLLHVQVEPEFDSLRDEPRFAEFSRRLGFPSRD